MADSILGLLFEISADPKKAEAALAELKASTVAESADISSIWSSAMNAITGPTGFALGAIVGAGGAMLEMANKAAEAGEQVLLMSQRTGIATETLGGLQLAAKLTNIDFGQVEKGLEIMSRNLSAFASTASVGGKALAAIGISAQDSHGSLKPMDVLLGEIADKFQKMPDGSDKAAIAMAIFGKAGAELIPVLDKGSSGIKDLTDQAVQMGTAFSQEKAEELSKYAEQVKLLKNQLDGMALSIGEAVIPALTGLFSAFTGQIGPLGEMSRNLDQIESDIKKYGAAVDETGRVWTKADLEQRKAEQSQEAFHPAIARTTDALKAQIASINQSIGGLSQFNIHLKDAGKGTEKHATATEHLHTAIVKANPELAKFAENARQIALYFSAPTFSSAIDKLGIHLPAVVQGVTQLPAPLQGVFASFKSLDQVVPDFAKNMSAIPLSIEQTGRLLPALKADLDTAGLSMEKFSSAMGTNIANAIVYGSSITDAMEKAVKAEAASIAGRSLLWGMYYTAQGIADVFWNPARAGADFASAAEFFAIGGAAAAVGASIPGGSGGGSGSGSGAGSGPGRGVQTGQLSGRSTNVAFGGGGGPQIAIYVDGIISADTMAQVIPQIIGGIQQGVNSGIPLYATGTKNRPTTTQGR